MREVASKQLHSKSIGKKYMNIAPRMAILHLALLLNFHFFPLCLLVPATIVFSYLYYQGHHLYRSIKLTILATIAEAVLLNVIEVCNNSEIGINDLI